MKFSRKAFISILFVIEFSKVIESQIADFSAFIFYTSNGSYTYTSATLVNVLTNPNFSHLKSTVFYFYGITHTPKAYPVIKIRDAYLLNDQYNFILFDIPMSMVTMYIGEEAIGNTVAQAILELLNAGLNISTLDLVGFSIGAQVAGQVAKRIYHYSSKNFSAPRVVALDPAILAPIRLISGDASFVMTVHTGFVYGDNNVIGDVAFWVNGGRYQPMCKTRNGNDDHVCNHGQVQHYWAEAVSNGSPTVFPARKCSTYQHFKANTCDPSTPIGYMNTMTSSALRANYFLDTNTNSPFSKLLADP